MSSTEPFRRPSRLFHVSDSDVSSGNDPPTGTLIKRCGETGQRGLDIRVLCPPCTRPFHGEATPDADSSDPSASLVSLPVIHELSPGRCRREDVLDSQAPRPAQIGLCPQFDQIPDNGAPMRQQADVGHAHDHATPVPVAVIPPHPLDAGNAFRGREEDPRHSSWARGSELPAPLHNTNAAAELSPWSGNPVNPGQLNVCSVRDDVKRTRPVTSPPFLNRMI